jgi:hypothetical protein
MIPTELQRFYNRWLQKSEAYQSQNLQDCFDKFFTLYVAYNRLYFELGISYVKNHQRQRELIRFIPERNRPNSVYISDAKSAKDYIISFLGARMLLENITGDESCINAVCSISNLLEQRVFAIKLDQFTRERNADEDSKLLKKLKSNSAHDKTYAILDIIYSIRCNMFHGQKGYENIQMTLLVPVTILLNKVMNLLYEKMEDVAEQDWWQ